MSRLVVQIWEAPNAPYHGTEFCGLEFQPRHLRETIERCLGETAIDPGRFTVVRLPHIDARGIVLAAEQAARIADFRVCLAIGVGSLGSLRQAAPRVEHEPLFMIDDVDDRTPLSDLAFESIHAVRFDARFVDRALADLRAGNCLDAMLGLCQRLGVTTFGTRSVDAPAVVHAFDYVRRMGGIVDQRATIDERTVSGMSTLLPSR